MNPEDNQPQAPVAGPAPEPANPMNPGTTSIPVTDQSDVANAINQLAADAVAAGSEPTPAVPASLDPTPAPAPLDSTPIPTAAPAPEAPVVPEAPAATSIPASAPAPDIAAAVTEMDADAVLDAIDQPETTPESEIPVAIGVDSVASANASSAPTSIDVATPEDSSTPLNENEEGGAKIVSEEGGDEEPIEPAEPVPGSIGSAINYSATAPDHSEPTKKPTGLAALFAKKPKPEAPAAEVAAAPAVASVSAETPVEPAPAASTPEAPVATIAEATTPNVAEAPVAPEHTFSPDLPVAPGLSNKKNDKKNTIILAGIILGAVALIAIIVFIIVFIVTSGDNKPTTAPNTAPVAEEKAEETSLVCSYTSTAEDIAKTSNKALASYEVKMIANYADDDLIDMSISGTYNYTDADSASEGARQARLSYNRDYSKLGLKEDPFTSNYPVAGNSFTASHFATADEIDDTNAALFYLKANSRGVVVTTKDVVKKTYTDMGYTCTGSEDEEKKDDTEEDKAKDDNSNSSNSSQANDTGDDDADEDYDDDYEDDYEEYEEEDIDYDADGSEDYE